MKQRIFWLVGNQLAGKTMLANVFASYGAQVLHIGQQLRAKTTATEFAAMENPYAPIDVETEVQEMIRLTIRSFRGSSAPLLVIDSAPKNRGQLQLLMDVLDISTIVFVLEDFDVRKVRARERYGNDLALFEKREAFEKDWIDELMRICKSAESFDTMVFPGRKA